MSTVAGEVHTRLVVTQIDIPPRHVGTKFGHLTSLQSGFMADVLVIHFSMAASAPEPRRLQTESGLCPQTTNDFEWLVNNHCVR
jgi:hypothetical protein